MVSIYYFACLFFVSFRLFGLITLAVCKHCPNIVTLFTGTNWKTQQTNVSGKN